MRPSAASGKTQAEGPAAQLIGDSPAHVTMLGHLERIAASEAPALIEGETGSGKELAAAPSTTTGRAATGLSSRSTVAPSPTR